jgi:hypothetical protein
VAAPDGYATYLHTVRQPACGAVAFYVLASIAPGSPVRASVMRRVDGGLVRYADQFRCTSCRRPVTLPVPSPNGATTVEV